MSPSYLRLFPTDTRSLIFSDPNKPVLLLLKVANLCSDFEQRTAAFTPTSSSPRPQAGAVVGRFTKASLRALVTGPQDTALNVNTLPANLAAPNGVAQCSFHAPIPSFNITGLFNFMTIPNFEALFNILVIFGLLYLFFTPPVGDDTTTYELFDLVDTDVLHDSESNVSKAVSCTIYNSATGTIRLARPLKTRSTSSVRQVAPVSFSRSLRRSPIKGSSAPRVPPQIASLDNPGCPVRGAIEPPAQVNPKATSSSTQTTEDISQATRPDSRGIQWWWDLDAPYTASDNRCEFFPSDSAQIPPLVIVTNAADSSKVHNGSSNLETIDTEDKAGSEVGEGKRKEVSRIVHKHRQNACPPLEAIPRGNMELTQKVIAPQVRTPVAISDFHADPQAQLPTRKTSARIQGPVPLPTSQQVVIYQPTVNVSPPAVPVGPIYVDVSMTEAPPLISMPVQPIVPAVLSTVPSSWLQQRTTSSNSYFPAVPPATIAPQFHIAQEACARVFTDHQSGSDQHMDITDGDGDSWMRPSGFGEATTLPEPATQTLAEIIMAEENTTQCTHDSSPAQQLAAVVAYNQTPAVGPTSGPSGLGARRLHEKARVYGLPYGSHSSISPLAPSPNPKVVGLRRRVELRSRSSTSNPLSVRNKNLVRASVLRKRFLLRKKAAARPPSPRCSETSTSQVDDQPETVDLIAPGNLIVPVDAPASPQKKGRSYFDRVYVNSMSPFSQRGPSEVSLMACKAVPKSVSPKKAFIWQCHFTARDRRAAGADRRIGVIYQNDPTTGRQVVVGSQRQPARVQRKAPVGDHVYPRRKRLTAADFIRAEDVEKEKKVLDATVDALRSMGLNSGNSVSASSSSASVSDTPETSPTAPSVYVVQDLEFHRDQAQLLLEDIFEDCEKNQIGLAVSFSPSSFSLDSGSDLDSGFDDD